MQRFTSNPFYYRLFGEYALFTDPVTKGGGEKFSYQIPTYQALKGITEQIYWKPTIYWLVDAMKVIKPIRTETRGIRSPLNKGGNDLNYYTYLRNVEYLVKVHFEWNIYRSTLEQDRNEKKHEQMILRALRRGGRRDIFLGTRECIGHIERITENEFLNAKTAYESSNLSFGLMFHSFIYPDESENNGEYGSLISNFAPATMQHGLVEFIRPEDCIIQHHLGSKPVKEFSTDNIRFVNDELEDYVWTEGEV